MAKERAYYSVVAIPEHSGNALGGILDMLRYDSASVLEVHSDRIVIGSPRPATFDRWVSFSLWVSKSYPATIEGSYEARAKAEAEYYERMRKVHAHMVDIVREIAEAN